MSLLRADALSLPLGDETVDLVVTSPPYFALRSYQDGDEHYDGQIGSEDSPRAFLEALWAVTAECRRVLKPSGSMFVNLGDKYAGSGGHNNSAISDKSTLAGNGHVGGGPKIKATRRSAPDRYNQTADVRRKSLMGLPWLYALGCTGALAALGGPDPGLDMVLRAEIVWEKRNGLPESVTDRVRRNHEQWFHLTREERYYTAIDEIREAQSWAPSPGYQGHARSDRGGGPEHTFSSLGNPLGKLPGSVWSIPSEPLRVPDWLGVDHFAAFPQEWPRRLILGWSPPGICVECGEGRRPEVDKERRILHESPGTRGAAMKDGGEPGGNGRGFNAPGRPVEVTDCTITGYSCACDTPDAPTRPAVVLDPFVGTGTVVGVANTLGRHGIGVDLSADYLRLARWRVEQSGHFAKTEQRTNAERQGMLL